MNCLINGKQVNVKVIESLGWSQEHNCYAKVIEFEGQ